MRDSVLLYRTTYLALKALPPEMLKEALVAICEYAMDDKEPPDEGIGKAMLEQCRLVIDKNNQRYLNGTKGGRPKNQTETKSKPNQNQTVTNAEPNRNQPVTIKDKGEKIKDKNNIKEKGKREKPGKPDPLPEYQYKEIIEYLNAKAGKKFEDKSKDTRKHINARIKEGRTIEDFKLVIDNMVAAWKDDQKMNGYLRPATLFGSSQHFENYMNVTPQPKKPQNRFADMPSRDYDMGEMERVLLGGQNGDQI